jgi:mRNA interferase RelE/StbE
LSERFRIAETETFSKLIAQNNNLSRIYKKITDYVYPILRQNPFFGPNIKRLKGELSAYHRYRIGDYRLFYKVDNEQVIVFIIDLVPRKSAYK